MESTKVKGITERNNDTDDLNLLIPNIVIKFELPNFTQLREERKQRISSLLSRVQNASLYDSELHNLAAVQVQKVFRGYLDRKRYLDKLYESVKKGEEELHQQQLLQVAEGEILVENYKMEQDLIDTDDISRNQTRLRNSSASTIQRAWRQLHAYKQKQHMCCSCRDEYPDIYEYYNETKEICFCCDYHKENPDLIEDFVSSTEIEIEEPGYFVEENDESLPYPTTDWLNIESVLTNKNRNNSDVSSTDIVDLKSRLTVNQDVKLTFVESYESANDIHVTYDNDEVSKLIEDVTNNTKSPENLEPVEESTRVLKSLKIHEDHEKTMKEKEKSKKESVDEFVTKTPKQLKVLIENIENEIEMKNLELMKELMMRDELNSQHESLLMDVGDLEENNNTIKSKQLLFI